MKFRVNLYPEELKPKVELFTLGFVLVMWALAGTVLFAIEVHYQSVFKDTQVRTRDIQSEHKQKSSLLKMLTTERDKREQDQALVARVEKVQGEVRAKQLLLEELKGREQLKNQGFASLMMDLAKNHERGLWLTRININEKNMRMEGGVQDSAAVPQWIKRLKGSEYFNGRNFAAARMYRDSQDQLSFVISSNLAEMALEEETAVKK